MKNLTFIFTTTFLLSSCSVNEENFIRKRK